jgi:hypothetical protein
LYGALAGQVQTPPTGVWLPGHLTGVGVGVGRRAAWTSSSSNALLVSAAPPKPSNPFKTLRRLCPETSDLTKASNRRSSMYVSPWSDNDDHIAGPRPIERRRKSIGHWLAHSILAKIFLKSICQQETPNSGRSFAPCIVTPTRTWTADFLVRLCRRVDPGELYFLSNSGNEPGRTARARIPCPRRFALLDGSFAVRVVVRIGNAALPGRTAIANATDCVPWTIEIIRALGGRLTVEIAAISVAAVLGFQAGRALLALETRAGANQAIREIVELLTGIRRAAGAFDGQVDTGDELVVDKAAIGIALACCAPVARLEANIAAFSEAANRVFAAGLAVDAALSRDTGHGARLVRAAGLGF